MIYGSVLEETKKLFIKHRYIVMVVSDELFVLAKSLLCLTCQKAYKMG